MDRLPFPRIVRCNKTKGRSPSSSAVMLTVDPKPMYVHTILDSFPCWNWRKARYSIVWTPIRYMTLHLIDYRAAASLCYRISRRITVFMCEQKPYPQFRSHDRICALQGEIWSKRNVDSEPWTACFHTDKLTFTALVRLWTGPFSVQAYKLLRTRVSITPFVTYKQLWIPCFWVP